VPPPDLEEAPNPYMNWETVSPLWWVPRGYIGCATPWVWEYMRYSVDGERYHGRRAASEASDPSRRTR